MSLRPVTVYAELTPNPNSLKFVADVMLLEGGTVEYFSKAEAVNCPLGAQLFDFSGVEKVFITSNFITITKQNDLDWFDITNILREFIRGYLMSGDALFIGSPFHPDHIPGKKTPSNSYHNEDRIVEGKVNQVNETASEVVEDPEAAKKIVELLDEYVRPAVEGDGGAIHFRSYENGVVSVALKGSCSGCPSSTVTLKSGIENLLKRMVPGVKEVVAVNE
jgi:NFU1 iron-sulfur cluster scaffold homolog, mitochondrial